MSGDADDEEKVKLTQVLREVRSLRRKVERSKERTDKDMAKLRADILRKYSQHQKSEQENTLYVIMENERSEMDKLILVCADTESVIRRIIRELRAQRQKERTATVIEETINHSGIANEEVLASLHGLHLALDGMRGEDVQQKYQIEVRERNAEMMQERFRRLGADGLSVDVKDLEKRLDAVHERLGYSVGDKDGQRHSSDVGEGNADRVAGSSSSSSSSQPQRQNGLYVLT